MALPTTKPLTEGSDAFKKESTANEFNAPWLSVVADKVQALRFGVIQITIHEGKVVQIESTERTRFDATGLNTQRNKANG